MTMKHCNFDGIGNIHRYSLDEIVELKNEFEQLCQLALDLRNKHNITQCNTCDDPISEENIPDIEGVAKLIEHDGVKRCFKCHYRKVDKINCSCERYCEVCKKVTPQNEMYDRSFKCCYCDHSAGE